MKMPVSAALLLLLSLCVAPLHAMQVDDDVTPEMREAVDQFVLNYEISQSILLNNPQAVEQQLARGADPNGTLINLRNLDYTVKQYAQQNNYVAAHRALARVLAEENPDPESLLHIAVRSGRDKLVRALLKYGANPECNYHSTSALRQASHGGYYKVIQLLIHYGADPNRLPANPPPDTSLAATCPSPLDAALYWIERHGDDWVTAAKLLLAHNARAHGPEFKNLSYPKLCGHIWKAEDPELSDEEAHEKQRQFTLNHWNIRNPAKFILDRRMGLVNKPRCKCWEVEV